LKIAAAKGENERRHLWKILFSLTSQSLRSNKNKVSKPEKEKKLKKLKYV
jgi:hypothetical protein